MSKYKYMGLWIVLVAGGLIWTGYAETGPQMERQRRGEAFERGPRAERMERGENGEELRALLQGARADLSAFLSDHAALDSAGSMRARVQLIEADLAGLG